MIISIDALKNVARYEHFLKDTRWDIVIIDDAHNVAGAGDPERHLSYRPARLQSRRSDFVLLITVTPHNGVTLDFSRPGKPTDNGYIESYKGRFREECLNANWFLSLDDAKDKVAAWREDYNASRPHMSLGYMPPKEFARHSGDIRGTADPEDTGNPLYPWT